MAKLPTSKTKIKYGGGSKKRKGTKRGSIPQVDVLQEEDAPMGLINGRAPKSTYEWNMARALWFYGWEDFLYQLALKGGYDIRGGLVLDFLVPTVPLWTPLPVDGGYWHESPTEERLRDDELLEALRNKGYKVRSDFEHAVDKNAATFDAAKEFIGKQFGRA